MPFELCDKYRLQVVGVTNGGEFAVCAHEVEKALAASETIIEEQAKRIQQLESWQQNALTIHKTHDEKIVRLESESTAKARDIAYLQDMNHDHQELIRTQVETIEAQHKRIIELTPREQNEPPEIDKAVELSLLRNHCKILFKENYSLKKLVRTYADKLRRHASSKRAVAASMEADFEALMKAIE
jgi:hypothetical protein